MTRMARALSVRGITSLCAVIRQEPGTKARLSIRSLTLSQARSPAHAPPPFPTQPLDIPSRVAGFSRPL